MVRAFLGLALVAMLCGGAAPAEAAGQATAKAASSKVATAKAAVGKGKAAVGKGKGKAAPGSKLRTSRKSGKFQGRVVAEAELRPTAPPRPSGNIHVRAVNSGEELKVNLYNRDGSYNEEALAQLSQILRCKRTGQSRPMEPRLLTVLSHVYDHFGERPLEVVSGFRFQRRMTSHHYTGTATDIRVAGIDARKVRDFVQSLDAGGMGVGYYPKTHFVHIDIRPLPSFRWTDNSRSEPNARDKQPPRGWKKKLRS